MMTMKRSTEMGKLTRRKAAILPMVLLITGLVVSTTIAQFTTKIDVAPTGSYADVALFNEQIKLLYTDEAVGIGNFTDDTVEPTGWELFPSIFWDSNSNGTLEANETIGHTLSPSVHFTYDGTPHHFWPLHQSIMQDPGDANVTSAGWISNPNSYHSKVEDGDQLITIETVASVLSSNSSFTQTINVTSTAPTTLSDVNLITYIGFDINGPFDDVAFIDFPLNNMLKAYDNRTNVWFGAYADIPANSFEVSEWNDGLYSGDDLWQHTLGNSLSGTSTADGDVEAALSFHLDQIHPDESRTITLHCSFGRNESELYTPPVSDRDVAILDVTTSKTGCPPVETIGWGLTTNITVTVENQGSSIETFNVTIYANTTQIETHELTLNPLEVQVITLTWYTTPFAMGNHFLTVEANIVPGETDVADNTFPYGWMFVTIAGDTDADRDVDIFDIVRMASVYGITKPNPMYDPNSDLDDDGDIDIFDIVIAASNYGLSW